MERFKLAAWGCLAAVIVTVAGGIFVWRGGANGTPARSDAAAPPPVPVSMATVEKADFPVYLNGLGTVQAFNTVVVRTRVDGHIDKIAFREGQMVAAGDVLAEIDPRPFRAALDQANAKKVQDEASLANAKLDLGRTTKLGDFASRQTLDTQTAQVRQLTAQVTADEAAIDNAKTQLDYATIRAPISGVLGFRLVDQGNIVTASAQTGIVTIAQIEPIAVIFTAPESQLTNVIAALATGPLGVTAFTADGRRQLSEGTLSLVNNQVDTATGTIRLKAVFENKDHALWPGLSVSARLLVKTLQDVTVVPDDAIQRNADGLYVFAVDQTNRASMRKVKVGLSVGGRTAIEDGLEAGERVIVSGQYRVQPGTLVAAGANPAAPGASRQ